MGFFAALAEGPPDGAVEAEVGRRRGDFAFQDETTVFGKPLDRLGEEDGSVGGDSARSADVARMRVNPGIEPLVKGIGGFDELVPPRIPGLLAEVLTVNEPDPNMSKPWPFDR